MMSARSCSLAPHGDFGALHVVNFHQDRFTQVVLGLSPVIDVGVDAPPAGDVIGGRRFLRRHDRETSDTRRRPVGAGAPAPTARPTCHWNATARATAAGPRDESPPATQCRAVGRDEARCSRAIAGSGKTRGHPAGRPKPGQVPGQCHGRAQPFGPRQPNAPP